MAKCLSADLLNATRLGAQAAAKTSGEMCQGFVFFFFFSCCDLLIHLLGMKSAQVSEVVTMAGIDYMKKWRISRACLHMMYLTV